ncbi:MAG TPA: DoxX family protein [Puia sp.]|nr:DoxX family protein [Puia sp.]
MKKTNIIYWIVTGLFLASMLLTALPEIRQTADANAFMKQLGYPPYFNPFLGVLKILGIIVLLVPGYPRLKEWAYAGFFFDLTGAAYSQIAAFGFKPDIAFMLIFFVLWGASYVYFHSRLRSRQALA